MSLWYHLFGILLSESNNVFLCKIRRNIVWVNERDNLTSSTAVGLFWVKYRWNMKYIWNVINISHHFTAREDMKSTNLPFNVWLHSSVGWALHRCRKAHEFESRWSPDIFQASAFELLKVAYFSFTRVQEVYTINVQIYYYFLHQYSDNNLKTPIWDHCCFKLPLKLKGHETGRSCTIREPGNELEKCVLRETDPYDHT